jgi:hypothetical protein
VPNSDPIPWRGWPQEVKETDETTKAIRATLVSPNERDSNLEAANVVDGLFAIARALDRLAVAVEGAHRRDPEGERK